MLTVEHLIGKGTKKLLTLSGINRLADAEVTGQDTLHVAVEHSIRFAEGKAHNGSSGVVTNPRQCPDEAVIPRESTCIGNSLCCGMKMTGTAIVAQPLPKPHHFLLVRLSKTLCRRKAFSKAKVIVPPLTDLRLLKDKLRQHDEVRVGCPAPWQITSMSVVPMLQKMGKCRCHGTKVLLFCLKQAKGLLFSTIRE